MLALCLLPLLATYEIRISIQVGPAALYDGQTLQAPPNSQFVIKEISPGMFLVEPV
jgi:hypothetical protein